MRFLSEFVIVLTILGNISCNGGGRSAYILEPDSIRNNYLKTETSLWEEIVNNKHLSRDEKLKEFYLRNNKFINSQLKNNIDIEDLKLLIERFELTRFHVEVVNVHRIFLSFTQHINREAKYIEKGNFNEEVSLDLIEHVLKDQNFPLKDVFERLNHIIVQEKLFLNSVTMKLKEFCDMHRSPHQIIYQLYDAITTLQLKAYAMIQSSFMLLNIYEKGDYTSSGFVLRKDYEKKTAETLNASQSIFEHADKSFQTCDPDDFVEGENFLQVTRLLQGYVENEINLNSQGSCTQQCSDYSLSMSRDVCVQGSVCNYQDKCRGNITNCQSMRDDMWICPGGRDNLRRYGYITYDNGDIMGKPYACDGFHLDKSWSSYLVFRCEHCICICDEQGKKSDRYFSLRPTKSDIKNNMVVTGVRFVRYNRIIHLQIQEGKLLSYGKINQTSLRWIPVPRFKISDKGIVDGIDYHTLSFERREFDFDDLSAPADHIVTGVKLRTLGNHLNLEIGVSEYNFKTGRISSDTFFWKSADTTEYSIAKDRRFEISMRSPDIPTRTKSKSLPSSRPNTFIKFTYSSIWKDLAQTTVPFLDAQEVTTDHPSPLQGIGLYWKAQNGFGGFIAPKILTIDYTNFVKSNLAHFKKTNEVL